MKTLLILLSLIFVVGSFAGETYKQKRTRRTLERMNRTIIHTEVKKRRSATTEYDYGINQYRVYKVRDEVNTDPLESSYYDQMMYKIGKGTE